MMQEDLPSDGVCLDFRDGGDRSDGVPVLHRWVLMTPRGSFPTILGVEGERCFQDRRGTRVAALALVRVARWAGLEVLPERLPVFDCLERPSEASSLADSVQKASVLYWVQYFFSDSGLPNPAEAASRMRRWFEFENVQGRRAGPMRVFCRTAELRPKSVRVRLHGERVEGRALDRLEQELSVGVFGSLPPAGPFGGVRVGGYVPTTGCGRLGEPDDLALVDRWWVEATSRCLVVHGPGGIGKTTLCRHWLVDRMAAGALGEATRVFSWSFYSQGFRTERAQNLAPMLRELTAFLGAEMDEAQLPRHTGDQLFRAIQEQPTLLFLDGLEVAIESSGPWTGRVIDPVLNRLISRLLSEADNVTTRILVSSRMAMPSLEGVGPTEVRHHRLRNSGALAGAETVLVRRLERALESLPDRGSEAPGGLVTTDREITQRVRLLLEAIQGTAAWSLMLCMGLFDRPPEWLMLALLMKEGIGPAAGARSTSFTEPELEGAADDLLELGLISFDNRGCVCAHPMVVEALGDEARRSLPGWWECAHRRLGEAFEKSQPVDLPMTLQAMEPLFRAVWHYWQARDYQHAVGELMFRRLAHGNDGYPIFNLGAYETALNLSRLVSPDLETFPPGCDLSADDRAVVIHAAALCTRYQDRLEEGYMLQKRAWDRITLGGCTFKSAGPAAIHLLRCQEVFGDLNESAGVLKKMFGTLVRTPSSSYDASITPEFAAVAVSYSAATVGRTLLARGKTALARSLMALAAAQSRKLHGGGRFLGPGLAAAWHALLLLELGSWEPVLKAAKSGELEDLPKRCRETSMIELVHGWALSESITCGDTMASQAEAILKTGLKRVKENEFRWWQAYFFKTLARHFRRQEAVGEAVANARQCREIAEMNGFKLLVIDADLELARLREAVDLDHVAECIRVTGYRRAANALREVRAAKS